MHETVLMKNLLGAVEQTAEKHHITRDDAAGMYFIELLSGMLKQDNVL